MLLVEEEEAEENEGDDDFQSWGVTEEEETLTTISINSIVGLTNPKTLKLNGRIGGGAVVVMVGPRATHNFISLQAVQKLRVPVTESAGFGVSLGNGEAVKGKGICREVRVSLSNDIEIQEDFLPLELGNSDVILSIQWLEKLGPVVTNWKTQEMKYQVGGLTMKLKGDPSLNRSGISLKAMLKVIRREGGGILMEFNQLEQEEQGGQNIPAYLQGAVAEFERVPQP